MLDIFTSSIFWGGYKREMLKKKTVRVILAQLPFLTLTPAIINGYQHSVGEVGLKQLQAPLSPTAWPDPGGGIASTLHTKAITSNAGTLSPTEISKSKGGGGCPVQSSHSRPFCEKHHEHVTNALTRADRVHNTFRHILHMVRCGTVSERFRMLPLC